MAERKKPALVEKPKTADLKGSSEAKKLPLRGAKDDGGKRGNKPAERVLSEVDKVIRNKGTKR